MTHTEAAWKQKGSEVVWSRIHMIWVSIFNFRVTDCITRYRPNSPGQVLEEGRQGQGKPRGLTSSSPADAGAARGCTRAARTWGTAWRQTRGRRRSAAREANQRVRDANRSEDTVMFEFSNNVKYMLLNIFKIS